MIKLIKNFKANNLKANRYKLNTGMTHSMFTQGHPEYSRGMTYVELIVVLGIFAALTGSVAYNYNAFQAKIDIKNLASDIALKIVEAQKSALNGKQPPSIPDESWKPSYGVYFDTSLGNDSDGIAFNKKFIYFVDLNRNGYEIGSGEMLDSINITKNNHISTIENCDSTSCATISSPISISFERPNSAAIFNSAGLTVTGSSYVKINISSQDGVHLSDIKVYPSGRIQVN